jgi:hypothetical protein
MKKAITRPGPSPDAPSWNDVSVPSFVGGLLCRLQAVKQQGGQDFWEFFPPLGNHLVAEQLECEQTQKQARDGANREGHINAAHLSCSMRSMEGVFRYGRASSQYRGRPIAD